MCSTNRRSSPWLSLDQPLEHKLSKLTPLQPSLRTFSSDLVRRVDDDTLPVIQQNIMDSTDLQQLPVSLRNLDPGHRDSLPTDPGLEPQIDEDFESNESRGFQAFPSTAIGQIQDNGIKKTNTFVRPPRPGETANNVTTQPTSRRRKSANDIIGESRNGHFGVLHPSRDVVVESARPKSVPRRQQQTQSQIQPTADNGHIEQRNGQLDMLQRLQQPLHPNLLGQFQNATDLIPPNNDSSGKVDGHFSGMKMIPNPPDLEKWRERLFNVDGTIILSEEESVMIKTELAKIPRYLGSHSTQIPNLFPAR